MLFKSLRCSEGLNTYVLQYMIMKRSSQVEIIKAIFSALRKQDDKTISLADLAAKIRIPATTIKRYVRLIQAIQNEGNLALKNIDSKIHPVYQVTLEGEDCLAVNNSLFD